MSKIVTLLLALLALPTWGGNGSSTIGNARALPFKESIQFYLKEDENLAVTKNLIVQDREKVVLHHSMLSREESNLLTAKMNKQLVGNIPGWANEEGDQWVVCSRIQNCFLFRLSDGDKSKAIDLIQRIFD